MTVYRSGVSPVLKKLLDKMYFTKPFVIGPLRHVQRRWADPNFREYHRLEAKYRPLPRYKEAEVKCAFGNLLVPDVASFLSAFEEIFVNEIYAFKSKGDAPVILDCGANIGLSVIYFKRLYPKSKVIAFEADPKIASYLKQNLERLGLTNVQVISKAVWTREGAISFVHEGADAGHIGDEPHLTQQVECTRLRTYLASMSVDFLKMDIEGAEVEVIKDCRDLLSKTSAAFVEFHSTSGQKQDLGALVESFESQSFRVHVHSPHPFARPFIDGPLYSGMDLRLNLFFWKH